SSRVSRSTCFESFRSARGRARWSRTHSRSSSTPATTSGPANGPRPASSAPATKRTPRRRSNASSFRPVRLTTHREYRRLVLAQLAHAGFLAHFAAKVVQLRAVHVADLSDLEL